MTVVAQQLQREGQEIMFAGPPTFRDFVQGKGLAFTPLPYDCAAMIKAHPGAATGGIIEMLRAARVAGAFAWSWLDVACREPNNRRKVDVAGHR